MILVPQVPGLPEIPECPASYSSLEHPFKLIIIITLPTDATILSYRERAMLISKFTRVIEGKFLHLPPFTLHI